MPRAALVVISLLFSFFCCPAHAQQIPLVIAQLAPPLAVGSQDRVIISSPRSGPFGAHIRFGIWFPTGAEEDFAGNLGLSYSLLRYIEAGVLLSARIGNANPPFRQGPLTVWARFTPLGRLDGFALGGEVQYAVASGPFDGGGQLVPDMETLSVLTGWRKSVLDLSLSTGMQIADHKNYLGGQGGVGLWLMLWRKQGLEIGGEAVGRYGAAAGEVRTSWLATAGIRLGDEYGVQAASAYARGQMPGAHSQAIVASFGVSFGPGYKRPEPSMLDMNPELPGWLKELYARWTRPAPRALKRALRLDDLLYGSPGTCPPPSLLHTWRPCQVAAYQHVQDVDVGGPAQPPTWREWVALAVDTNLGAAQSADEGTPPTGPVLTEASPPPGQQPPGIGQVRPPPQVRSPYPPSMVRGNGQRPRPGSPMDVWQPPLPRAPRRPSVGGVAEPPPPYDPIPPRPPRSREEAEQTAHRIREELEGRPEQAQARPKPVEPEPKGGTYVLQHPVTKEVMRTGRGTELKEREGAHRRDPALGRYDFKEDIRTDDKDVQRGRAQQLHEQYKPPLDKINDISPRNPNRPKYMKAAEDFMRRQAEQKK